MSDFNGGAAWSPCSTCGWPVLDGDEQCPVCGCSSDIPAWASSFDPVGGEHAMLAALDEVERGADPEWQVEAWSALRTVVERNADFTTDEVWFVLAERGVAPPREPRALGPIMRQGMTLGMFVSAGRVKKSVRVGCHRRPVAVYTQAQVREGGRR